MAWQYQEAQQKFSEVVQRAHDDGPQIVTRHGEELVVVLSAKEFPRLSGTSSSFKAFLLSGPDLSMLELECRDDISQDTDL